MSFRTIAVLLLFLIYASPSFPQGLHIKGNDALIDERSSYNVFEKISPTFNNILILDFEIIPARSRGSIVRIKDDEAGSVYNISYNEEGDISTFKLNHEGRDNLISISLKKDILKGNQWIKAYAEFDMIKDSVKLRINEKEVSISLKQSQNTWNPHIYFGRSEHVIDVPDFKLRNLIVRDNDKTYFFPLNESEGESVHDSNRKITGHVTNPVWLINDAYHWKLGPSFSSRRVAGSNFNPTTQDIYYFNEDSITVYNVRTNRRRAHKYHNRCPMEMRLGTNFMDQKNNRLYIYEVADPVSGNITIAYLDLHNYEWTTVSSEVLPMQLHHHSNYMDAENGRYIIFGGFGRTSYFNNFYSFNLHLNHWEKLEFGGDTITPRYFTSMGYNEADKCLYLFGGMGNKAGDQTVGRVYYYELYKIDTNIGKIEKIWEIPWNKENAVPVRNMFFPNKDQFYILCYPEHVSHSFLKLYRFSTADGAYKILGDSIPILSEKITTNANIYYNMQSNELLSIVQEFERDDRASTAKVYSISFPPVTEEELTFYSEKEKSSKVWIMILIIGLIILLSSVFMHKKKRKHGQDINAVLQRKNIPEHDTTANVQTKRTEPNSIYLFGEFSLIDKHNREINYMLSSKLRQAFFLILYHSLDKGITSQDFSKILWPNKSYEMSKNSRGVTLNNLRKILGDLDGTNLVHDKRSYKITFSDECYCDYLDCLNIVSGNNPEEHMDKFISIISRGKFLESEDSPILDPFKGYIESKIESTMYYYMEKAYTSGNYTATVSLCESFFNIDPLDGTSLQYLIKSLSRLDLKDEAKRRYYLFTTEYKKTMGEEYDKPFADLLR
ncbi:two-component SAPR family response regulator [Dysgonomonas hofstadii]|uniref:Two-component SAPR family response regulator n=2 Tax=Dysgonomonas hofstadii TaxID=637886 RepID=A0A840CRD8_9BACT|nr:two-component SAPR family response regulator [Dysgonomonas hofstadii]